MNAHRDILTSKQGDSCAALGPDVDDLASNGPIPPVSNGQFLKSESTQSVAPMTISPDNSQSSIDPSKAFTQAYINMKAQAATQTFQEATTNGSTPTLNGTTSTRNANPTAISAHPYHLSCPSCGHAVPYINPAALQDPAVFSSLFPPSDSTTYLIDPNTGFPLPIPLNTSPSASNDASSPLVVPMGPLAAAAFESGMSAVEELKLLKAQVQDVARVCNAVARGDLSQKITVPVQGVVMVQLKDVINTMVDKLGQFAKEVTRVSQEVGTEGYVSF